MTEVLRIGVARRDITPPLGVELCGYGRYLNRKATAIHDHLYARVLVMETTKTKAAVLSCDLPGITRSMTESIRHRIEEDCKLPASGLMIGCSHTHSGPATIPLIAWGKMDDLYLRKLEDNLVQATKEAIQRLTRGQASFFEVKVHPPIATNRISEDLGIDPMVRGLLLSSKAQQPIGLIASYPCHAVILGSRNTEISGDFPGRAMQILELDTPGLVAAFIQGTSGDINPKQRGLYGEEGWRTVDEYACRLATSITEGLERTQCVLNGELRYGRRTVVLPLSAGDPKEMSNYLARCQKKLCRLDPETLEYRRTRFEIDACETLLKQHGTQAARQLEAELQVIALGDLALVGLPGEAFHSLGRDIAESSPFGHTIVLGLTNDALGYFPRPVDYLRQEYDDFGGYAAKAAPKIFGHFPFGSNVEDLLRVGAKQLLDACVPAENLIRGRKRKKPGDEKKNSD